jgi:hypothetical protein
MSIINEALKKAQKDLKKKDATGDSGGVGTPIWIRPRAPQPAAAAVSVSPSLEQKKIGWHTIVLWEILALCVIGAVLFSLQPRIFDAFHKGNIPSPHIPPVSASPKPQTPAVSIARPVRPPPNAIILNGIMRTENKWTALMNDEIYEEGDYIKNKKIDKISAEGVTLLDGKKTIFLSARHKKTPD